MSKQVVMVAGNLGVGKTTFVELIGKRLNWNTVYESVDDNPYLSDYYNDMHTWSFHLQIYFLGHRSKQYLEIVSMQKSVIMDRSIYEDANVFARALHQTGKINRRDYFAYLQLYEVVERILPPPDLLVYLKAPLKVLLHRIKKRGLGFDYRGINEDYLALIDYFYNRWIKTFDKCPILKINTEKFDFINDIKCLEKIIHDIQKKLG